MAIVAHNSSAGVKVYSGRGHVVGVVRAGVLRLSAHSSRGMLRQPPAWCIEVAVIDAAERAGAERIEILDKDTGQVYTCALAQFRAGAFGINRGFGEQWALPLARWAVGAARQLSLWGRDA